MSKPREYTTVRYRIFEVTESDAQRRPVPGAEYDLDLWYSEGRNGADTAYAALEMLHNNDPGATFMVDEELVVVTR